ncbi:MAG: GNAT family N-acetyltransferase [Alistipes sp.]|nr:GNAT family N-acetyltransferase [Alistipes sp.]
MIQFQPILKSDRTRIEKLLLNNSRSRICDHTFTNLYAWQATYQTSWAEVAGALVVRYELEGEYGYMVVAKGEENFREAVTLIDSFAHSIGQPMRLLEMSYEDAEWFGRWVKMTGRDEADYATCDNRDHQDYIYSLEDLSSLRGRKYQPKRNHVNKFESLYDYSFEELREEHFEECLKLECRWQRRKSGEADCSETSEQSAIRRVLEAYAELGITGRVIIIDGHVAAFTYGSPLNKECFCTHIEKADAQYEGIFPMINRLFADVLLQKGFRWVNREEDMGLAGLRRSKLSYHPTSMQEKVSVKELSAEQREWRTLWMECFGDEREWVDRFLIEHSTEENTFIHKEQGAVVAMLHLVELQTEFGRTAYLYAIATAAEWRGRGLASKLVGAAVEAARERGYDAVAVIPAQESLVEFYERLGFGKPSLGMDFSSGMDLGTGDAERDVAMVMKLK